MDGISAASAITGLVAFAGALASKGYHYIRAVKNCDKDVQTLIAETSSLVGLLTSLDEEFQARDQSGNDKHNILQIPQFVYDCNRTLNKISEALRPFDRTAGQTNSSAINTTAQQITQGKPNKPSRHIPFTQVLFSELKWPLKSSETTTLIQNLERHKTLCILALSAAEWSDVREILGQQKDINNKLDEININTIQTLDTLKTREISAEVEKILKWLSSHDPSNKHQIAREVHQDGTGEWIFDVEEYRTWIQTPSTGLWLHGIPGAGKTILSSLIIERVFHTTQAGAAYYYCDYQNASSQEPANVLGSWLKQLALQSDQCLRDVKLFYNDHHPKNLPVKKPTLISLGKLLQKVSEHFDNVTLILDGLDECGSAPGIDRSELLQILSTLHHGKNCTIRTMITSRAEFDIETELSEFANISIAARSADLQIYVTSEVIRRSGKLKFRDKSLRLKVIDRLIEGSDGMFIWVKCQLDYLSTLPNDKAREKALETLPPGLPATYIRILERIEREFSPQTTKYVQRILKWLALYQKINPFHDLTLPGLVQAISLDDQKSLDQSVIPDETDVREWCGSLVRLNPKSGMLEFSHFTVKEFLYSSTTQVDSKIAHKYLVDPVADYHYLAETCIQYLSLQDLTQRSLIVRPQSLKAFTSKYGFYAHAAGLFPDYFQRAGTQVAEAPVLKRFFTKDTVECFLLWNTFRNFSDLYTSDSGSIPDKMWQDSKWYLGASHRGWRAIQLSACLLLEQTTKRLIEEEVDLNDPGDEPASPLHLAIGGPFSPREVIGMFLYSPWADMPRDLASAEYSVEEYNMRRLSVVKALVQGGSLLNFLSKSGYTTSHIRSEKLSPLCTSIYYLQPDICKLLLASGAEVLPTDVGFGERYEKLDFIMFEIKYESTNQMTNQVFDLLLEIPDVQDRVRRVFQGQNIELDPDKEADDFKEDENDPDKVNETLITAGMMANVKMLKWALDQGANVNHLSKHIGQGTAIYHAAQTGNLTAVRLLFEAGADIHIFSSRGDSAFSFTLRTHGYEHAMNLFGDAIDLELTSSRKMAIFRSACTNSNTDLLEWIITTGIEVPDDEAALEFDPDYPELDPVILQAALQYKLLSDADRLRTFETAWISGLTEPLKLVITEETVQLLRNQVAVPKLNPSNIDAFEILAKRGFFDIDQRRSILSDASIAEYPHLETLIVTLLDDMEYLDAEGCLPIHRACLLCDPDLLEILLDRGSDPNAQNTNAIRPLHLATAQGSIGLVEILIKRGADPNGTDADGYTPLHHSARTHNGADVCKVLLAAGANPNIQSTESNMTPMHVAAAVGSQDMLQVLLSSGADFLLQDDLGHTPIHTAATRSDTACLQVFFSSQITIPIDLMSVDYFTPLLVAAHYSSLEGCQFLLDHGANVNHVSSEGFTAINLAAQSGSADLITVLLEAGAMLSTTTLTGSTPLHFAVYSGEVDAVKILLEKGLSLSDRDHKGYTPMILAAANGQDKILKELLSKGADVNALLPNGRTSLHEAIFGRHYSTMKLLVEYGASVNCTDDFGMTPLDVAQQYASEAEVRQLVEVSTTVIPQSGRQLGYHPPVPMSYQAARDGDIRELETLAKQGQPIDLPEKRSGLTPLHHAVLHKHIDTVKWLQKHNVNMLATNKSGENILHFALKVGAVEIYQYALEIDGLDPMAADNFGRRPLHIASAKGPETVVKELLSSQNMTTEILNSNSDFHGTSLAAAAFEGHVNIVELLVDAGAQLNGCQSNCGSPLFSACVRGHRDIVQYLLKKGASTSCSGYRYSTAMEIAIKFKQLEVVEELEKFELLSKDKEARAMSLQQR